MNKKKCEFATRTPATRANKHGLECICTELVSEAWISRRNEEVNGVSTPARHYWCAKHGIRGEERINKRMDRSEAQNDFQVRMVLKDYTVEPYPAKELREAAVQYPALPPRDTTSSSSTGDGDGVP